MIDVLRDGVAWLFILAGSAFLLIGALGLTRMPDAFARMQSASLIDTTGAGLILVDLMVVAGFSLVTLKLLALLLLIWFLGPVATHAIARAAYNAGLGEREKRPKGGGRSKR